MRTGADLAMSSEFANSLADAGEPNASARSRAIELLNSLYVDSNTVVGDDQDNRVLMPASGEFNLRCAGVAIDVNQAFFRKVDSRRRASR